MTNTVPCRKYDTIRNVYSAPEFDEQSALSTAQKHKQKKKTKKKVKEKPLIYTVGQRKWSMC